MNTKVAYGHFVICTDSQCDLNEAPEVIKALQPAVPPCGCRAGLNFKSNTIVTLKLALWQQCLTLNTLWVLALIACYISYYNEHLAANSGLAHLLLCSRFCLALYEICVFV